MLELRPNCETCDKDLPPDSTEAYICSYECTYCAECAEHRLNNVCPNCGGGLTPRPIRPQTAHRPGLSLHHQPASNKRVKTTYSQQEITAFTDHLKTIKPEAR